MEVTVLEPCDVIRVYDIHHKSRIAIVIRDL